MINNKLSLYRRSFSQEDILNCIAVMEKNWTKDLKILLGSPVPYEIAAGLVVERLNIIQEQNPPFGRIFLIILSYRLYTIKNKVYIMKFVFQ